MRMQEILMNENVWNNKSLLGEKRDSSLLLSLVEWMEGEEFTREWGKEKEAKIKIH